MGWFGKAGASRGGKNELWTNAEDREKREAPTERREERPGRKRGKTRGFETRLAASFSV